MISADSAAARTAAKTGAVVPEQEENTIRASKKKVSRRLGGGGSGGASVTYLNGSGQRETGVADWSDPYWNAMRSYYDQMYDSRAQANDAAAAEAAAQAARTAEAERSRIDEGYRGVNRQLYRDYMENRRRLPAEQAARGYSGGLTESGMLRLANAYGESLAQNERARLSELAAADEALARREYEARAAAAKANAQADQERYAAIAALRQEQYRQLREDRQSRAALLAGAGDYSGYGSLGYSQEDIDYLSNMWRQKNPKLAPAQATGKKAEDIVSSIDDSSVLAVARYIAQTQSADAAVDYVAAQLARGGIFADEAQRIYATLRG